MGGHDNIHNVTVHFKCYRHGWRSALTGAASRVKLAGWRIQTGAEGALESGSKSWRSFGHCPALPLRALDVCGPVSFERRYDIRENDLRALKRQDGRKDSGGRVLPDFHTRNAEHLASSVVRLYDDLSVVRFRIFVRSFWT